jgi:hypothetical protein
VSARIRSTLPCSKASYCPFHNGPVQPPPLLFEDDQLRLLAEPCSKLFSAMRPGAECAPWRLTELFEICVQKGVGAEKRPGSGSPADSQLTVLHDLRLNAELAVIEDPHRSDVVGPRGTSHKVSPIFGRVGAGGINGSNHNFSSGTAIACRQVRSVCRPRVLQIISSNPPVTFKRLIPLIERFLIRPTQEPIRPIAHIFCL